MRGLIRNRRPILFPLVTSAALWCNEGPMETKKNSYTFVLTKEQQEALFGTTARALGDAPREIKVRHIGHCLKADPAYGKGVAAALGIPLSEVSGQ